MSKGLVSPYLAPGFYEDALARGHHRDIVGGRWEETGRVQLDALIAAGLLPHHRLLDIGAGSLRLGCKAVPYLDPGNYWATDASGALLRRGYELELADKLRLRVDHLIEDAAFDFPGVPDNIDRAIAFAVFTHLPMPYLRRALVSLRQRFPRLEHLLFTVFLAPDAISALGPVRQPDGVVTHDIRAPYHLLAEDLAHLAETAGYELTLSPERLPRGQVMAFARPLR